MAAKAILPKPFAARHSISRLVQYLPMVAPVQ
jgi:hypothetical protein